jgi:DNA-binding MarR family transcriptional regulator
MDSASAPFTDAAAPNIGLVSYERVTAEMRKAAPSITARQMLTFIAVVSMSPCSQIEICGVTGFTRQATSRHVAKLVRVGLLTQRRDLYNGRCQVVRLTASGRLIPATLGETSTIPESLEQAQPAAFDDLRPSTPQHAAPMNADPDSFTEDQRKFLAMLVSDLNGPTSTGSLLRLMESVVYELKSDFDLDRKAISDETTRADLEVCFAALQYLKVKQAADDKG